ncbi:leucine-rich repeat-containing protein 56-like isoform X2 [Puntigrus tetrazona]|uniref:leucine-rich repeat-containing protein 56-like isoform X2 n=1 Tax=Puntigrus tetrazona TaxID=1606681 RepID=UPI001C89527F|nr:leucine-rich repeat-containing protein 56-like isoform X2 [Puntigrus tetrazona]
MSMKKRPGSALSVVTEFSGSGFLNPKPAEDDPEEDLLDQRLSPHKLKIISGSDDLHAVTSLEMCVDTRQKSLDNFGNYLPKLTQLKMNNSLISSVRDLGTGLSHLQVLCLARCGLTDLEGISALSSLKELYVAFNRISELSPVSLLEDLELLDLEENELEDLAQLWYLGRCVKLRTLSLEGNPVCLRPAPGASEASGFIFRSSVRELIPQLIFLDDVPAEEDKPSLLRDSIEDASVRDGLQLAESSVRPASARPLSSCSGSRADLSVLNHEASDLTNGVGGVLCGNPLQAARARRQRIKLQNSAPQTRPSSLPENTREETSPENHRDVLHELRTWRIEHERLLFMEKEREPQVTRIHHSDEDEDEDEGRHSLSSDDITGGSPDWSVRSETLRLSSSSGCSMSPSPPPRAAGQRLTQIRRRRLLGSTDASWVR